jgi:hypothetical protein
MALKPPDPEALMAEAKASCDKEAYHIIEKTKIYRIGVGANADSANSTPFFVEVTICLATETSDVDLPRLERTLRCLRTLKERGYHLTYQDGNSILCEAAKTALNMNQECVAVKSLMKAAFA